MPAYGILDCSAIVAGAIWLHDILRTIDAFRAIPIHPVRFRFTCFLRVTWAVAAPCRRHMGPILSLGDLQPTARFPMRGSTCAVLAVEIGTSCGSPGQGNLYLGAGPALTAMETVHLVSPAGFRRSPGTFQPRSPRPAPLIGRWRVPPGVRKPIFKSHIGSHRHGRPSQTRRLSRSRQARCKWRWMPRFKVL